MFNKIVLIILAISLALFSYPYVYNSSARLLYTLLFSFNLISVIVIVSLVIFSKFKFWKDNILAFLTIIYCLYYNYLISSKFNIWVKKIDFGDQINDISLQIFELNFFRIIYFGSVIPFVFLILYLVILKYELMSKTISTKL